MRYSVPPPVCWTQGYLLAVQAIRVHQYHFMHILAWINLRFPSITGTYENQWHHSIAIWKISIPSLSSQLLVFATFVFATSIFTARYSLSQSSTASAIHLLIRQSTPWHSSGSSTQPHRLLAAPADLINLMSAMKNWKCYLPMDIHAQLLVPMLVYLHHVARVLLLGIFTGAILIFPTIFPWASSWQLVVFIPNLLCFAICATRSYQLALASYSSLNFNTPGHPSSNSV